MIRNNIYRLSIILLLMLLGISELWGQTDYSGTYYIASCAKSANNGSDYTYSSTDPTNNFYLCPTKEWIYYQSSSPYWNNSTPGQPFLTTFKCRSGETDPTTDEPYDEREARWTLIKHPSRDCYYIRRNIDGKYLTLNDKLGNGAGTNRIRVHIETPESLTDNHLFAVETQGNYLVISPVNAKAESKTWYLNVHQGNFNFLTGQQAAEKNEGPTDYKNIGGIIGIYSDKTDRNAPWRFEDVIFPVLEQQNDNTITITCSGCTIYYTTDGSMPDPANTGGNNSTQIYIPGTTIISMTNPVTTVRAVAVKTKDTDEAIDTYSRAVSLTTKFYIGIGHPYLVQNQENANFYMIPVTDTQSTGGYTKTHTTSLGQPSMMWYFKNAGNVGGVQYYYMVNKATGQHVYYHEYVTGSTTNRSISIDSSDTFDNTENKDKYCFSINSATDGGFNICPKIATNRCIYKNSSNQHNSYILAHTTKTDALGRWTFISVPDEKMPAVASPITVSNTEGAVYYSIENVKTPGNYISPDTYVTTSTSVTENEKWCFVQADKDDWLTYYYIVNAVSGEYLYLNNTSINAANAVITKTWSEGSADEDKYQFVLAPSSTEACFIIPKTLATQKTRVFNSLYSDTTNPLKIVQRRYWVDNDDPVNAKGDDAYIRWTFNEVSLTNCQNPVFEEKEGKLFFYSKTFGSEIRYTTDGTTPTSATETVFTGDTDLPASNQYLIKAIAVLKNDADVTSEVRTLFNKPDVTLASGPYEYKADFWEPAVSLSVGETTVTTGFTVDYADNKNAGTASVTITNSNPIGSMSFLNVPVTEFTIDPKALDITANTKSIEYGDEPANGGVTYTGFAGSETEAVLDGELTYEYNYERYGHVSDETHIYTITPGGLTSTNYDIHFVPNTLTVNPKSLGSGTLASNYTINLDDDNNIILRDDAAGRTLELSTDYIISDESISGNYSTRTITSTGNYTGSVICKTAIVHFTTDADQDTWSATFVAESSDVSDIGHVLPKDMAAFIILDIDGAWAIPEPLDYIPAGVPVLLMAREKKNGFLVTEADPDSVTDITAAQESYNKLKAVTEESAHFNTKEIYVLYKNEFVLNKSGDLGRGKVYMDNPNYNAPSSSPAPSRISIAWDDVTGIKEVSYETEEVRKECWYTLDGRCLSGRPDRKGLYIVNGKKTMVK